jgi:inhibitor of cysteine peptidase
LPSVNIIRRKPMITRILLLCTLITLVAGLAACAPAPSPAAVTISCDDYMKMSARPAAISREAQTSVGSTLTVTLCSNATTGYKWLEQAQVADASIVQQADHKYNAPTSNLVGAAGAEIWTFKALKKGTTTITNEYGQPWAGGEKSSWKFNLKVTVN